MAPNAATASTASNGGSGGDAAKNGLNNRNDNNISDNDDLPLMTWDAKQPVRIRYGPSGQSSRPSKTLIESFDAAVEKYGDSPALYQLSNTSTNNNKKAMKDAAPKWKTWTFREYRREVDRFAKSLITIGFERHDAINVLGFNAPEWFFANYGAIVAGGVSAGIYATNQVDACQYVTEHSRAKVVVCDGLAQLEKYKPIASNLLQKGNDRLKALVVYGLHGISDDVKSQYAVPVYAFDEFQSLGRDVEDPVLKERGRACRPGETCTLIYTSGTTGPPKAVMLTHDNVTWTVDAALLNTPRGSMDPSDCMISYLPLSHIAAQMIDMHMPLASGCRIYFARPDALKGSLAATLKQVRPTIFFGVPRVWEKFYDKMQEVGKQTTGLKKQLSTWAKSQYAAHWDGQQYGHVPYSAPVSLFFANVLLSKVHAALGFDRCYGFYVGAAPLEVKIFKYFASLNILITELFGQSECTGPHTVSTPTAFKFGSVGQPLLGTESKIDPQTGELCYRGRHIFAGYMGMREETLKTIDGDGWLHSGDIAKIDDDHHPDIPPPSGFLYITGRIKELIITAGGENVAPVLIEEHVKDCIPAVSNVMIVGDKRKFLAALLCLQVEVNLEDGVPTNKLTGHALDTSKEIGSTATTTTEAQKCDKWKRHLDDGIQRANEMVTSRAQRIAKWTVLDTDFSERGGELTPTLKLKRGVAAEKYRDAVEAMYSNNA